MNSNAHSGIKTFNEKEKIYTSSKWCFDTPGVVQPDQILHLLTTEELMKTIPKQIIQPQTFNLKPGMTIFIAGIGRLDFIESEHPNRPLRYGMILLLGRNVVANGLEVLTII